MSNDEQHKPIRERSDNEIQRQAERSSDPPVENEIEHQVQRGEAEWKEEEHDPPKDGVPRSADRSATPGGAAERAKDDATSVDQTSFGHKVSDTIEDTILGDSNKDGQ